VVYNLVIDACVHLSCVENKNTKKDKTKGKLKSLNKIPKKRRK
jgi:hypothetical protein